MYSDNKIYEVARNKFNKSYVDLMQKFANPN